MGNVWQKNWERPHDTRFIETDSSLDEAGCPVTVYTQSKCRTDQRRRSGGSRHLAGRIWQRTVPDSSLRMRHRPYTVCRYSAVVAATLLFCPRSCCCCCYCYWSCRACTGAAFVRLHDDIQVKLLHETHFAFFLRFRTIRSLLQVSLLVRTQRSVGCVCSSIGWYVVTKSMVTIRSPFCGYKLA